MKKIIKDVFAVHCKDLVIDDKLVKMLNRFDTNFINKNQDHIAFFGGMAIGVNPVRYTEQDSERWFYEILGCDESQLTEDLLKLPSLDHDKQRIVTSDATNLSYVYLAHLILIDKKLSKEIKHMGLISVFSIMLYKFLTSLLSHYFKYPANEATMDATIAQLNNKFDIKRYGNWLALIRARAEDIIRGGNEPSIHYQALLKMDDDDGVIYLVSDTQTRIRNMIKNFYSVFIETHDQGIRIHSVSSIVEHDGEQMLKDKSKSAMVYSRYLNSVVIDSDSFIREELLVIIEKIMHTMSDKLFRETLLWMSKNYRQPGAEEVEYVLNETVIHSLDYFSHHTDLIRNTSDLPELLSRLRGVYMSSRSTDPVLFALRDKLSTVITKATGNKNQTVVSSVRTGILLYLVLRTMTMRHYSK